MSETPDAPLLIHCTHRSPILFISNFSVFPLIRGTVTSLIEVIMQNTKLIITDYLGVIAPYEYYITSNGDKLLSCSQKDVEGLKALREAGIDVILINNDNIPLNADLQQFLTESFTDDDWCSKSEVFCEG